MFVSHPLPDLAVICMPLTALVPTSIVNEPVDVIHETRVPRSMAPVDISILRVGSTLALIGIFDTEPEADEPVYDPFQLIGESKEPVPVTEPVPI